MKLAIFPTAVLLILVAGPIEQSMAGLGPLESFAKGFVAGLVKSLKAAKLREAGRRQTFSGRASADLSFGGHVAPLGASAQNGWRGSRIDLSGNLDVQGKKFPITRPDGGRTIRKQFDGTVTFDANITRFAPTTTTIIPVVNTVLVVPETISPAPLQEVFVKPESEETFTVDAAPEPQPILPLVTETETEPIHPPMEEIAPVIAPEEITPEFIESVDEIPVTSVDSESQTVILTELDAIPESKKSATVEIIQSNDDLSNLKGVFNLNVANTGSGTGAVIHINQPGSGSSSNGISPSGLDLPIDQSPDTFSTQVDTGSTSSVISTDDFGGQSDVSDSPGFDSFFNGENLSGNSETHVDGDAGGADYFSGVEAEAVATVDGFGDGVTLDTADYSTVESPAPIVPDISDTHSGPSTIQNIAVGFVQNGHVMMPNGKLYPVRRAPLLYKYSDVIESPDAIQTGSISSHATDSAIGLSEAVVTDSVDSLGAVAGEVVISPDTVVSAPANVQPAGEYVVETLSQAEGTTGDNVDATVSVSGSPPNLYGHYVQANVDSVKELSNIALRHGNGLPLTIRLRTRHRVSTPGRSGSEAAQNVAIGSLQNGHVMLPNGELLAVKRAPSFHRYSDVVESPDSLQVGTAFDTVIDPENNVVVGASAAKSILNAHADTNTISDNIKILQKEIPRNPLDDVAHSDIASSIDSVKITPQDVLPRTDDSAFQFLARFAEAHRLSMLRNARSKDSTSIRKEVTKHGPSESLKKGRTLNRHSTFEGELYRDRLLEVLSESGVERRSLTHFRRADPRATGTSHGKSTALPTDQVARPPAVSSLDLKENSGITRAKLQYRHRQAAPS